MKEFFDYETIYTQLIPITDFNANTGLYLYQPDNMLFILKKEDLSAKPVYEAMMSISNPHLAKILYIADCKDHIEIVLEYISGISIDRMLSSGKIFSTEETKKIGSEICDGLLAMHRKGLVHRDITPNNIIINHTGTATIIDYGITRAFDAKKNTDTVILGTPGYAAPEQFGFSQSDARTDIYAVGVLLNVMLTGKLPNEKCASGELGRIIRKCIEIDSHKRYKSIDLLNAAINNMISTNGSADRIIQVIPGLRSKHISIVIISLCAYIFAGILTVAVFDTSPPKMLLPTIFAWCLIMPIPFSCFTNFLGIWDLLPFTKGSTKRNQGITYTAIGIQSLLIGLLIFGSINKT